MATQDNLERIEAKVLGIYQKAVSLLAAFLRSFLSAAAGYIRSKTKFPLAVVPKRRREIVNLVLEEKRHQDFLQKFSLESGILIDHVEETFRRYLHEIAADLNYLYFPFVDSFFAWAFESLYEGLEVNPSALDKIRSVAGTRPIVFVSNHRSHMDYVLLSYIFYHQGIPMPHICAGANLSFWPLGSFSRKCGAFFIRRSFEGNKLYKAAVQAYLEEILREKACLEFFIEGTRSRTGKLLSPKMGILSAIGEAFLNGAVDEVLLIPTSLTYESVLEEKSYLEEQAGASKKEESFWDLFRIRKYLTKRKGKVYVQFGDPISLRDFLEGAEKDEKRERVQELAYELTYGINKSTVVTPASLVATALLTHPRRSISEKSLEEKISHYLDYLRFKECRLSETLQKYRKNALREALKNYSRNHLIEEYADEDAPLYTVKEDRRPLLDYYKNTSLHFFVSMGVLTSILNSGGSDKFPMRGVEADYAALQDLFKYEFTFSRRQSLRSHLEKLIDYLEKRELVRFEDNTIKILPDTRERLEIFSSPLRNFFEGYYILWKTLPLLTMRRWEFKDLVKFAQERGRILYLKEEIFHPESSSRFTLQNALVSFRDLGIVSEEKEGWGKRQKIFYRAVKTGEELGARLRQLLEKKE